MPVIANDDLRAWSAKLLELAHMRLVAEQAPVDQMVRLDMRPFGVARELQGTVGQVRYNLDLLFNDLVERVRTGNVAKVMADPFPEEAMKYAFLLGRELVTDMTPKMN